VKIRTCLALSAALLAVVSAAPGIASAAAPTQSIYTRVLTAYQSRGTINPCDFTASQLEAAKRALGTAGGQYFGDFAQAIQTALSTRAAGGCSSGSSRANRGSATGLPASGSGGPPLPQVPLTSASGAGVPAPLIAMAVLLAAFAVISAAFVLVRRTGVEASWAAAGRHSVGEAADRLAAVWEDFADWLRSGRRDRGEAGGHGGGGPGDRSGAS
jgi:hypothetical protein